MPANASRTTSKSLSPVSRKRVLAAARECFERLGIEQATIVDIATAAGYSRPIVYKHFNDKAAIIDALCLEEMAQVQSQLFAQLGDGLEPADELTEAIVVAIILAHDNLYIRRFMEDRDSWLRSQKIGEQVRDWVRRRWESFLRRGRENGILADDIEIEDAVTWIALNQSQLLLRYRDEDLDKAQLRQFVRRFVVSPLLVQR